MKRRNSFSHLPREQIDKPIPFSHTTDDVERVRNYYKAINPHSVHGTNVRNVFNLEPAENDILADRNRLDFVTRNHVKNFLHARMGHSDVGPSEYGGEGVLLRQVVPKRFRKRTLGALKVYNAIDTSKLNNPTHLETPQLSPTRHTDTGDVVDRLPPETQYPSHRSHRATAYTTKLAKGDENDFMNAFQSLTQEPQRVVHDVINDFSNRTRLSNHNQRNRFRILMKHFVDSKYPSGSNTPSTPPTALTMSRVNSNQSLNESVDLPTLVYQPKKKIAVNYNSFNSSEQTPRKWYGDDGLERVGKYLKAKPHTVLDVENGNGIQVNLFTPLTKRRIIPWN